RSRRRLQRRAHRARVLPAAWWDRRRPRARRRSLAARGLAGRAAQSEWCRAVRPRARRADRPPVTFEEARAAFPVLERTAYLNAGTNGPLAKATVEAMVAQELVDLAEGRAGATYHAKTRELRERVREKVAALIRVPAENLALTTST